jgi:hypothetical protein
MSRQRHRLGDCEQMGMADNSPPRFDIDVSYLRCHCDMLECALQTEQSAASQNEKSCRPSLLLGFKRLCLERGLDDQADTLGILIQ